MRAVIMAGGKGTRLYELTKNEIPKPMVQLYGKPLLQWQIEALKKEGILDIIIVVGYMKDKIQSYFKDGKAFDVNITYIEEYEPLGTAGALSMLKDLQDNFLLIYGDLIFDINVSKMMQFHTTHSALITAFVHPNSHPFDSDIVVLEKERIKLIDSKHNNRTYWYSNCTNAGIYIVNPSICKYIACQKTDFENDVLMKWISTELVFGYKSAEYVKDVGTIERIRQVEEDIKNALPLKRNSKNKQKAFFLDRDGTINQEVGLISDPSQLVLAPRAADAIKLINQSEYLAIIVTNQPVIAKGMCDLNTLNTIHDKLETLLGYEGAYVDAIYYCPHHPDRGFENERPEYKISCNCRKPNIGMLQAAARDFNIDFTNSWTIGDREIDIQTGINAGTKTARVGPEGQFIDLANAVSVILEKKYE